MNTGGQDPKQASGYNPDFDCSWRDAYDPTFWKSVHDNSVHRKKEFVHYMVFNYIFAQFVAVTSTPTDYNASVLKSETFKQAMKEAQYVWARHREEMLNETR